MVTGDFYIRTSATRDKCLSSMCFALNIILGVKLISFQKRVRKESETFNVGSGKIAEESVTFFAMVTGESKIEKQGTELCVHCNIPGMFRPCGNLFRVLGASVFFFHHTFCTVSRLLEILKFAASS